MLTIVVKCVYNDVLSCNCNSEVNKIQIWDELYIFYWPYKESIHYTPHMRVEIQYSKHGQIRTDISFSSSLILRHVHASLEGKISCPISNTDIEVDIIKPFMRVPKFSTNLNFDQIFQNGSGDILLDIEFQDVNIIE